MHWLAERIEHWPIERLIPYANNARTHSADQIALIAGSIKEFGFVAPVLVGSDGVLIAGHGRVLAARQLGMKVLPVLVIDHLTPAQRRALVLADNRIAELAGWDNELLRLELEALQADGFDLDLVGFDPDDLAELVDEEGDAYEADEAEDDLPVELPNHVTQRGDVWHLGPHRLVCGDATTTQAYDLLMERKRADMVFTDPPYNVDYSSATRENIRKNKRNVRNDSLGHAFPDFLFDACTLMIAHCKGGMYICMSTNEIHTMCSTFGKAGGYWADLIIWVKHHFTLGNSDYQRQYEPILYGWPRDGSRYWCGDRDQTNCWHIKRPQKNDLHPTMKPVELVERAVRNSSEPGGVVLDSFAGSGSTLIACHKADRVARLMEIEPKYCDVIVRRWQDFSGLKATRGDDGMTFDDAAVECAAG